MNPLQEQVDALQTTMNALDARVQALETQTAAYPSQLSDNSGDRFIEGVQKQLHEARKRHGEHYGLAVVSVISQVNNSGHSGTAFGMTTIEHARELPSDAHIEAKCARARLILDPLVLRCLREFVALCFEGQPMEVTSDTLAARLGTDAEQIEAALAPLVQSDLLRRILRADGTPLYTWEGNDALPMHLLFG